MNQSTTKSPLKGRELLLKAVDMYLNIVKNKLAEDNLIHVDSKGNTYRSHNNLIGSTYARMSFTNSEQTYFYEVYDKLWSEGYKTEAYCLMRMVFGIMSKNVILQLYRCGHLFNYRELLDFTSQP